MITAYIPQQGQVIMDNDSAGLRTNEALCQLSYEAPYLGPEGGRPGRPTQTVRHTCSGNLGIVKILCYVR